MAHRCRLIRCASSSGRPVFLCYNRLEWIVRVENRDWRLDYPKIVNRQSDEGHLMRRIQLEENELQVLRTLEQRGAMSPSQVSASTWLLPGETLSVLKSLSSEGLVLLRNDMHSPDGLVVAITQDARTYLRVNTDMPPAKKRDL